jgi:hypothetical protein
MDNFVIWGKRYQPGSCVVSNPSGFEDQFMLAEGVSLLGQWPANVVCKMSPKYPKDIELTDNLHGGNYPVISQRLKTKIAASASANQCEFLPVSVLNHKGRVASKDYFILNPVGSVDCIDTEESEVEWNDLDETDISEMERLVLRENDVPAEVNLFRAKYLLGTILVRRSLADQLSSDGFTGLYFREPTKFRG